MNSWKTVNGTIYESDAIDLVKNLPSESIDLVITDIPYESLEKWRATGTTTRLSHSKASSNDWFKVFPNKLIPTLLTEFYRVLKPGTFLYMFCDEETRDIICCGQSPQSGANLSCNEWAVGEGSFDDKTFWSPITAVGFKYWKSLIWHKQVKGMGYHFPAEHEFIIMAEKIIKKGKHRQLNTNRFGDVLEAKRLKGKQFYPTEKPKELLWVLISESSNAGDCVLDPFCGSGNLGEVCESTNRKYILGDINTSEATKRLVR